MFTLRRLAIILATQVWLSRIVAAACAAVIWTSWGLTSTTPRRSRGA